MRDRAPDLIVYFDDLVWRSVGSVGINSLYTKTTPAPTTLTMHP
ncbi:MULTISPECIES: hypothetical protein [Cyanophyceae]|nr:hypothetical protein [Nodosilinea sp. FACHB-131]